MKTFKAILFFGLIAIAGGPAFAHQDRLLPIGHDGAMPDVPPEYGPANLRINFSSTDGDDAPVSSVDLTLGTKRTHLPSCVTGLLLSRDMKDVRATGSWYHQETRLPYYISLMFFDSGQKSDNWAASGFSLLFNLRTGKLLKMEVHITRDGGQGVQMVPVDLAARCAPDVLESFIDVTEK